MIMHLRMQEKRRLIYQGSIKFIDVQFHGMQTEKREEYQITFSRHGYCDMALIHLKDKMDDFTIFLEPFVMETKLFERLCLI